MYWNNCFSCKICAIPSIKPRRKPRQSEPFPRMRENVSEASDKHAFPVLPGLPGFAQVVLSAQKTVPALPLLCLISPLLFRCRPHQAALPDQLPSVPQESGPVLLLAASRLPSFRAGYITSTGGLRLSPIPECVIKGYTHGFCDLLHIVWFIFCYLLYIIQFLAQRTAIIILFF